MTLDTYADLFDDDLDAVAVTLHARYSHESVLKMRSRGAHEGPQQTGKQPLTAQTLVQNQCGRRGVINLNGVGFGLTVFNPGRELPSFNNPGNPLRGSLQRPRYMAWEINGVQKRVNFTWSDIWEHKTITYTMNHGD